MQGFATPWVTPYDLKIQPRRRDETRIKKRAEGRMASIGCCFLTRRRDDENDRGQGLRLTATVRNGDIDHERKPFKALGSHGTVGLWNPRCLGGRLLLLQ